MKFYSLTVARTIERIPSNGVGMAKTVEFEIPQSLLDIFTWEPGQHITLKFLINGEEVIRSYTISASPYTEERLQITVKRVTDGLVSNYINDQMTEGAMVQVAPPKGNFKLEPEKNKQRTHYFFAAGSGITPIYAMINSVLVAEPNSICHLLYANRNDQTIIFKDELDWLDKQAKDSLTVAHILSKPRWTSSFEYWKDGKINAEMIEKFIQENPPYAQDAQYYICGPGNMNIDIKSALKSLDVPDERIHFESFGQSGVETDGVIKGVDAALSAKLDGNSYSIEVTESQTLLEAMRTQGLTPPYSCQSGVCGTCTATLISGDVSMKSRTALSDKDIEQGQILTCQAVCQSSKVEIVF